MPSTGYIGYILALWRYAHGFSRRLERAVKSDINLFKDGPMRVLLQRVSRGCVRIDDRLVGQIDQGLVLLIGIHRDDGEEQLQFCVDKCVHLRIFADEQGKMNRSLLDVGGSALAISQFTLYGDCRKGRRPGFDQAARPEQAKALYERFGELLSERGIAVEQGVFAANMQVEIHNDGPVTLMVESP